MTDTGLTEIRERAEKASALGMKAAYAVLKPLFAPHPWLAFKNEWIEFEFWKTPTDGAATRRIRTEFRINIRHLVSEIIGTLSRNDAQEARIKALEEEVGRLRAERVWRTIESAPKDGTEILGYDPIADAIVPIVWDDELIGDYKLPGAWVDTWLRNRNPDCTYWQPLPPSPKDGA